MDWDAAMAQVADPGRPLPSCWWLAGPDSYRAELWHRALQTRLGADVEEYRAEGTVDLSALTLWLSTRGFLDQEAPRLLWWQSPDGRQVKGAPLEGLVKAADARHLVVAWSEKHAAPAGFQAVDVGVLRQPAWAGFVRRLARQRGVVLAPAALELLARATHPSGHQLEQALAVLRLAAGGESPIPAALVRQVVAPLEPEAAWAVTDALLSRQTLQAYQELRRQLEQGVEPVQLLAMMVRSMAQLAAWLEAQRDGKTSEQFMVETGLKSWQWRPLQRAADHWRLAAVRAWFARAATVDQHMKSSGLDPAVWLAGLVLAAA
jgi:DNA polymerase III delta subunit